LTGLVATA
jgi:hypothetical protein